MPMLNLILALLLIQVWITMIQMIARALPVHHYLTSLCYFAVGFIAFHFWMRFMFGTGKEEEHHE